MKKLYLNDKEFIELDKERVDEFCNIGLTLEEARKYIDSILEHEIEEDMDKDFCFTKQEIDNFLNLGYTIEAEECK